MAFQVVGQFLERCIPVLTHIRPLEHRYHQPWPRPAQYQGAIDPIKFDVITVGGHKRKADI